MIWQKWESTKSQAWLLVHLTIRKMRKRNTENTKHERGMRKERWKQMFNAYPAYVMFNTSPLNSGGTDSHPNSCKWNKRKRKFTEGHLRNEVWECEIVGDDDSLEKVMSPNESSPWCNHTEKFKKQEYILIIPLDLWIRGCDYSNRDFK